MPVNEKKLLEKFITIEVALNALAKVCMEAKNELNHIPHVSSRRADLNRRIEEAGIKRDKALLRSSQRKLQNQ